MAEFEDLKALVIDDNEFIRLTIKELLQGFGIKKISEAENGKQALNTVSNDIDLIICDIHMEPVNGFEFLKKLRESSDELLKKIPVLFLTGDADADLVKQSVDLGVNGYLLKPITREGLRMKLAKLLGTPAA